MHQFYQDTAYKIDTLIRNAVKISLLLPISASNTVLDKMGTIVTVDDIVAVQKHNQWAD